MVAWDQKGKLIKMDTQITTVLASIVVFGLSVTLWRLYNLYSFFKIRGLKGPTPIPLFGNMIELLTQEQGKLQKKWVDKYGKVFGAFFGLRPRLFIADPEVMIQICVKDFDAFPNHADNPMTTKYHSNFLVFLKDDHWRKVRALMSPTFTSGKIRRMIKFLDGCADDLVECFREQLKPESEGSKTLSAVVNGKDLYSLYTMDAIATCCYGLKMHRSGANKLEAVASRDDFVRECLELFKIKKWRVIISLFLPVYIMEKLGLTSEKMIKPVADFVTKLIDKRRESGKKFDDYLQLLVDTKLDVDLGLEKMDMEESHYVSMSEESMKNDQRDLVERVTNGEISGDRLKLTDLEILSNAIFLLIVGLETTGTLLAHISYALAFHQNIQEKLYQEIKGIAKIDETNSNKYKFDYDQLTSSRYLDAVVSETLRCLPAISLFDRSTSRDYYLKKYDILIPKGTNISLAYHSLLNDSDYWKDPEVFDPDRFLPENKEKIVPGSYVPFGIGPRHCVGMRFSLTETKLAIAKLLMNYHFEAAPGTKFPPDFRRSIGLNLIKNPIIKVTARKTEG